MRFDFKQGNLVEAFVRQRKSRNGWLDEIDQLIDWSSLELLFDNVYASREGAASYPMLVYVKLLLIRQWHGLSDEQLEAAVDDRRRKRKSVPHRSMTTVTTMAMITETTTKSGHVASRHRRAASRAHAVPKNAKHPHLRPNPKRR